jgi:hypothetical protein
MNKALLVSAAVALALSASAFAKGGSHSGSSGRSADSGQAMNYTQADCHMLTVESARADCMRSTQGGSHDAVGASDSRSGSGMTGGGSGKHNNKTKHRKSHNRSGNGGSPTNNVQMSN